MTSHDGLCMFCELKPLGQHQDMTEEDLQMRPHIPHMGPEGGRIHPEVECAIYRARGGGQPLNGALKEQMSTALRHDFNEVRVHTGPEADRLNRQLHARAFTVGSDIFFRRDEYDPTSLLGRELIAHELTHVVQQRTGRVRGSGSGMTVRPAGDTFELEANVLARQAATAGNEARKVGKKPCAPGERVRGKRGSWTREQVMPAEKKVASMCPPRTAPAIDKRFPVIQRSAASLANIARYHGKSGWTHKYRPTTCNEAALGWLLKSMSRTHPWQLMRQICIASIPLPGAAGPGAAGPGAAPAIGVPSNRFQGWMRQHIYHHNPHVGRLTRNDVMTVGGANAPQPGDILYIPGAGLLLTHSMVVVQGPPNTLISGFNNAGTFNLPAPPPGAPPPAGAGYDIHPRDVTFAGVAGGAGLWHPPHPAPGAAQTFGAVAPGGALYRVTYNNAMMAMQNALAHWSYSWFRTPGWQHMQHGCMVPNCPHSHP